MVVALISVVSFTFNIVNIGNKYPYQSFSVHKLDSKPSTQTQSSLSETPSVSEGDSNLETSRFASETLESERESLNAYKQATANAKGAPQIVIDPPGIQGHGDADAIRTEEEQSMSAKKIDSF